MLIEEADKDAERDGGRSSSFNSSNSAQTRMRVQLAKPKSRSKAGRRISIMRDDKRKDTDPDGAADEEEKKDHPETMITAVHDNIHN